MVLATKYVLDFNMASVVVAIVVDMSMSLSSAIASSAGTVIEEINAPSLMTLILVRHVIHLRSRSLSSSIASGR